MSARLGLLLVFAVLIFGTAGVFLAFDANSHSASDTLRPFLLTMLPVWAVALYAAARIVLRTRPR